MRFVLLLLATTAYAEPPKAATKALVNELAAGKRKLADLVDPKAGVVLLERFDGPGEPPPKKTSKLLCGKQLTNTIATWQARLAKEVPDYAKEGHVDCENKPAPMCTYGRVGEWDPAIHLRFRLDDDKGLLLTAISIDDEVLVDEAVVEREHRTQTRLITKLSASGCP